MSFKYFRHTLRRVNTTQKAPAAKNTTSTERLADLIDGSDIRKNNSVEKHLAEVIIDDHGHSILKESGLTRGHSILESSSTTSIASLESFLDHKGEQSEDQFGEDGLSAAGGFGRGMASEEPPVMVVEGSDGKETSPQDDVITGDGKQEAKEEVNTVSTLGGLLKDFVSTLSGGMPGPSMLKSYAKAAIVTVDTMSDTKTKIEKAMDGTSWDPNHPSNQNANRPGVDDNNGGEGGFMTWKLQDQLSNGLNNVKDPITNPNGDDFGSGYLSDSDLIQMGDDLRNAKDPATNWGDDTYNNFMGAVEMNIGEISLKAPATNWGDNDTSNSDNVVDTLFTVQNDF